MTTFDHVVKTFGGGDVELLKTLRVRMILSVLVLFGFLVSVTMHPVYGAWVQQDFVTKRYTEGGHLLGKFYAVQGSPDAVAKYYPIVLYVDKSAPQAPWTLRVTSFKKEDGESWKSCTLWIFCTFYSGAVGVKKYEDYYDGTGYLSADPEWEIIFEDAYRYVDGSKMPYDTLDQVLRQAFDAVLSLAGSPIGGSWIFDVVHQNSDVMNGLGTSHLTVSLKTGSILWQDFYDAKYGLIKDKLSFDGAGNWAKHHGIGYSDWIGFGSKYVVTAGYWTWNSFSDTPPVYVPVVKEDDLYMYTVDVRIVLQD